MALIEVSGLTFCYEGSFDTIFENMSFVMDTSWKLGLLGRNGKGKTTLARLLLGREKLGYRGTINTQNIYCDYFPYKVEESDLEKSASELTGKWKSTCEEWKVIYELSKLDADVEILYRPFRSLSHGERTKVMLAVLFSGDDDFLIIDEPTNHLDHAARKLLSEYLQTKSGFILISHDRELLDSVIDHVLVLNRKTIEVQQGNFSSWWVNKQRADANAISENEKHLREIAALQKAVDRADRWAKKNEATKIGFNPVKEPDRFLDTRAYIGAKTKKMQSRVKSFEKRMEHEIEEKEGLLQDIEKTVALKIMPVIYHKDVLVRAYNYEVQYADAEEKVFQKLSFEIRRGERIFLDGKNGCGKSTLVKQILGCMENEVCTSGELQVGAGLKISYINQDTSFLSGSIYEYAQKENLDESLLLAILRQLDFSREQFGKPMETYSEGQKKKVLIAGSLLNSAHLYIWDEPLNYVDVFSRMQIEELILKYQPTMLIVDHDGCFRDKIATGIVSM